MEVRFTSEIFNHLMQNGDNTACAIEGEFYTYQEFSICVGAIQQRMLGISESAVGVLAQNTMETYAALVAAWLCGKAYVPINANYPAERNAIIFEEAGIRQIFYAGSTENPEISSLEAHGLLLVDVNSLHPQQPVFIEPGAEKTAYILFTSGTTGKPKGVPISFGNLQAFYEGFLHLGYEPGAKDRFLQMFELTFDLSVMCFLVPLTQGASFYTLPNGMIKTLGLYHILESMEITFSLMVPSAIQMLMPYLDDIALPALRVSQFCGEALKLDVVEKWSRCIPNAVVDNVYGPTEATIYCTAQRLIPNNGEIAGANGVAGIGKAMHHVQTAIFQDGKEILNTENNGELCLAGAQLTSGYLNNPGQNEKAFFEANGIRYYKTGDLVFKNQENNLMYCGRLDDQVKIQGYRIELAELEMAGQKIAPDLQSVAIGLQDSSENWLLILFVKNPEFELDAFHEKLKLHLPEYMVPHRVLEIEEFPLNSNGKTDKKILREFALKHL